MFPFTWILIDSIQVDRCFLFRLSSRQEDNTWNCSRHSAGQGCNSSFGILLWSVFCWTRLAYGKKKKKKKKAHEKEHHSNSMWYKYYNITTAGINQLSKLIVLWNLSKVRAKLLLCSTPILFLLALLLPHLYLSTSLPCTLLTPSIWR